MTKKEIKQYAKEHKCSIREAQRQLGGEATGNVSNMSGTISMYDYISKKANKDLSWESHADGLCTVIQALFMGDLLEDMRNIEDHSMVCVNAEGWNQIATDFMNDNDLDYLPVNITTDTFFSSSLGDVLKSEKTELIANSLQYWLRQSIESEKIDFDHMVMMNQDLAGTKDHAKSVSQAVRFFIGPFQIIVKENYNKTTSIILGVNKEDQKTGPDFEDSKQKDTVSSIMQKVFDKFAENIDSDPYKNKQDAENMEIVMEGIRRIVIPFMDKHNITANDFTDLIDHEDTALVGSFGVMVETCKNMNGSK